MSYTELLLVGCRRSVVGRTTSRFVAEPAHPVVGLTNEIKSSGSRIARKRRSWADPPRGGSSGDRSGDRSGRQDRGATPDTAASRSRLSGPAAALDKYEHAPHDGTTVGRAARRRSPMTRVVHDARQRYRDERLDGVRTER